MTGKRDVSNEVELKNGRGLPGWSAGDIVHQGQKIGTHYCGSIKIEHPDYNFEQKTDGNVTRVTIYKREIELTLPRPEGREGE